MRLCATCIYFDKEDRTMLALESGGARALGLCRRNAPVPSPGREWSDRTTFARVKENDWCGQHEPGAAVSAQTTGAPE